MLANRLKQILHHVIFEPKSAFVPSRLITNNIMISYELTHHRKRKTRVKVGYAALKDDTSQAYDRVEWQFIEQVMHALGFPKKWIQWTMICISSVKDSISADATQFFSTSRGLRQGCPLLPYLFILCAEGFSSLLRNYEQRGLIQRCKIARGAPSVSHIFFADDCLLWFRGSAGGESSNQNLY